jgi:Protein of unknown function (DUF2877)
MRLQATSVGAGVPGGSFTGVVHSVFRRACNIRTDGGDLLALLAPELGNLPHGIRIEAPPGLAFAGHFRAGQRVGCRAALLRAAGSGLAVDLRTATRWRSELKAVDLARPVVAAAWQVAWRALQHRRQRDRAPLLRAVQSRALALAGASRALDLDRATAAVRALIGCGPGLTPAGDDLIVGLLAGLRCTAGDDPARACFLRALGAAVASAALATGEISQACLRQAIAGAFSEPIVQLAGAIADGLPPMEVEAAARRALWVGHTSGGDGVQGLLLGMQAWSGREFGHG